MPKCEIKGCSQDCEICIGNYMFSSSPDVKEECVYHHVWRMRGKPNTSSPYVPLTTTGKEEK